MEGDEAEAVKCYRIFADLGEPVAMTRLGMLLEEGRGVERYEGEAVRLYKAAIALRDDGTAKNQLYSIEHAAAVQHFREAGSVSIFFRAIAAQDALHAITC